MTETLKFGSETCGKDLKLERRGRNWGNVTQTGECRQKSGNVTETLEMGPKLLVRNPNLRGGAETGGTLPKPGNVTEAVEM